MPSPTNRYPLTLAADDANPTVITLMTPADAQDLRAFIARLPQHDLLFLRRDISHPKVLAAWMDAITHGSMVSLVARVAGRVEGCTAIVTDALAWSRHVGELRVLVGPEQRGKGLGRVLIQECFLQALDMGLEKLCVQMTVDQQAAVAVFEGMGFRAEALLANHVKDRDGKAHDLVLLSHDVQAVQSRMQVYGMADISPSPPQT